LEAELTLSELMYSGHNDSVAQVPENFCDTLVNSKERAFQLRDRHPKKPGSPTDSSPLSNSA
jgi:hypothetical protein